ncbi:leucine-rich repeat domain-containing protein [Polaribacter sp. IC073]|uniref:leucine-rich repeat domain-containing protein n=1 Tax=Polaribacter sp. IC073 TaxID=2508540 RepID=UPI0011BFBA3B|nr:hypothetical protein [Polaribacter sp. IC073]TXD49084.1 hypothetical protein ES045_03190 [Polaribacter sp. IC073]
MSKYTFYFILTFTTIIHSQNYVVYSDQFDKSYSGKHEVDISHLKKFGFQDVFAYNSKDYNEYKDSIDVISKIKYVTITVSENLALDSIVTNLKRFNNIEYIKFKSPTSFFNSKKIDSIIFPKNIYQLKNIKTVSFYGDFNWNQSNCLSSIAKLPKLENIIFTFNQQPDIIFKNPNFLKLNFIKGLSYSSSKDVSFPDKIKSFKNLTSLALNIDDGKNTLEEINKFSSIKNLKYLHLGWLNLNDSLLANFSYLKELSLSSVKIENSNLFFSTLSKIKGFEKLKLLNTNLSLTNEIGGLKSLKEFYSANNIFEQKLPETFYDLKNLEKIEIQGSRLEIIDEKINQLKNLTSLKLYFNNITVLPKKIGNLSKLKQLYLNHNKIKELPEDIGTLNISYLSLNNNLIETLPKSFTENSNLDSLMLHENYIKNLPKKIGDLKKLKHLNLELNNLNELPKSFKSLINLEYLNISRNRITHLPNKFGKLKSLKILDSEFNLLTKLPTSFGELEKLERVVLTNNNLKELSDNFGKLKKLKKIYLYNRSNYSYVNNRKFKKDTTLNIKVLENNITKLPISFSKLPVLEFIELSLNKNIDEKQLFEVLKKSIFENYTINLEECNIENLPKNGWKDIKAKDIDLRENFISEIPQDMINAKYLTTLNLNKNKGFNTYRGNKAAIDLLFVEKGFINENSIEKSDDLVIAYAKTANKKYSNKDFSKNVKYTEKAFAIDSILTYKHLYEDNYIKSLYHTKNYTKAIAFANAQIKKDTSQNIRFLNSILPNFEYKSRSLLAIGDTIQAIQNFEISSRKFSSNNWTEAGMLSKKMKKDSIAEVYFNNSFDYYKSQLKYNPKDWGNYLSLVEAYIIGNKINLASEYINRLDKIEVENRNYKSLIPYFQEIINIAKIDNHKFSISKFENLLKLNKFFLKNWSFKLIEDWLILNNLSEDKNKKITELNNLYIHGI